LMAQLAPIMLVAYITTMLSADIRHALSRIKLISETDELTGIYNVRAFTALADRTHKQAMRYGHSYSIVMLDSDNLKAINDTWGHEAGSRLLKLTVTTAQKELRQTDVLSRYGGDEFVVLLPQTGSDGAREVAERIRRAIEATPLDVKGAKAKISISAGFATYPEHGDELAAIMNRADQALYVSKKEGRNRVSGQ
jgi:diguanylate cyclase (GGDEF)-like protein